MFQYLQYFLSLYPINIFTVRSMHNFPLIAVHNVCQWWHLLREYMISVNVVPRWTLCSLSPHTPRGQQQLAFPVLRESTGVTISIYLTFNKIMMDLIYWKHYSYKYTYINCCNAYFEEHAEIILFFFPCTLPTAKYYIYKWQWKITNYQHPSGKSSFPDSFPEIIHGVSCKYFA